MSKPIKLNRRSFLAAQACVATAGVSGAAGASIFAGPVKWETLTHKELAPMIGESFSAATKDGLHLDLELVGATAVKSGWHRPLGLARAEGVVAEFKCPQMDELVKSGHQSVRIDHDKLGKFDLFLGAVPNRSGGHIAEAVLN